MALLFSTCWHVGRVTSRVSTVCLTSYPWMPSRGQRSPRHGASVSPTGCQFSCATPTQRGPFTWHSGLWAACTLATPASSSHPWSLTLSQDCYPTWQSGELYVHDCPPTALSTGWQFIVPQVYNLRQYGWVVGKSKFVYFHGHDCSFIYSTQQFWP